MPSGTIDDGYGDDYGHGDGSGDGHGDGYGHGHGSGYGDGYGYGHGRGDGYGDGSGYGHGSGDGYGDGYGHGDGDGYWQKVLSRYNTKGGTLGFWSSDKDGCPCNGGKNTIPAKVGLVEKIEGPLKLCRHALHATTNPTKWKGTRLWVVALHGEVQQQDDKLGALEREIIAEIT